MESTQPTIPQAPTVPQALTMPQAPTIPAPPPLIPPPPVIPPPPAKPAEPPQKPAEKRCVACINYHLHDHPSVLTTGANLQTYYYPADSVREKYDGILIKELPEWFGRLKFRSGATYQGGFRAGEFNGFGHYVMEGQYEYLGGYSDGKKEGYGREIIVTSWGGREEYVGGWKDNEKHGEGLKNGREWVRFYMGNQLQALSY